MNDTDKDPSEQPDVWGPDESGQTESDTPGNGGADIGGESPSDPERAGSEPAVAPQPQGQEITQADIDALMANTLGSIAEPSSPTTDAVSDNSAPTPHANSRELSPADTEALLAASGAAEAPLGDSTADAAPPPHTQPFELTDLRSSASTGVDAKRVTMLNDVNLRVKLQLGQTRMLVEEVLKLGEGSVVELDKLAGDPVDVVVNDRLVARGEVLVLNDNFCVRVSEVLSRDPHRVTV